MAGQGDGSDDVGLEMLSRLFEEEVPEEELLNRLISNVPSSVDEELQRRFDEILARNETLEHRLSDLESENKTLQEKNELLRNNLTAVYRTSLAMIKFRDSQIAVLRKQLQSVKDDQSAAAGDGSQRARNQLKPFACSAIQANTSVLPKTALSLKLQNILTDKSEHFGIVEPCSSVPLSRCFANDNPGLINDQTSCKSSLSKPDVIAAGSPSGQNSTLLLEDEGTVVEATKVLQSEVIKERFVSEGPDSSSLPKVVTICQKEQQQGSESNSQLLTDSNVSSRAKDQQTVATDLRSTTKEKLQMANIKTQQSPEGTCAKPLKISEVSPVKSRSDKLNSFSSPVENLDKTNSSKEAVSSKRIADQLKQNDDEVTSSFRSKAKDLTAPKACLVAESRLEKVRHQKFPESSGSRQSKSVNALKEEINSSFDDKTLPKNIQKDTFNDAEIAEMRTSCPNVAVKPTCKSDEVLRDSVTDKGINLNFGKNSNQLDAVNTTPVVDLRMKLMSKVSRQSHRSSSLSEYTNEKSSRGNSKHHRDKPREETQPDKDEHSKHRQNDENSRTIASVKYLEGKNRINEQKSSRSSSSRQDDAKCRKRKPSTDETDDKKPHVKKGKRDEGSSIQDRLVRISDASRCHGDSSTAKDYERINAFQPRSTLLSTSTVQPEKCIKNCAENTSEIEQMQRYIELAARHETAQKIVQKEAKKFTDRILKEKHLLASERKEEDTVFSRRAESDQNIEKEIVPRKKQNSDAVTPSLTLFSRRAQAKLKQASPAMMTTSKIETRSQKLEDTNPEDANDDVITPAMKFQLECLKNVSVGSLELSKILEIVSSGSVSESRRGNKSTEKEESNSCRSTFSAKQNCLPDKHGEQNLIKKEIASDVIISAPVLTTGSTQPPVDLNQHQNPIPSQSCNEMSRLMSEFLMPLKPSNSSICCSSPLKDDHQMHPIDMIHASCQQSENADNNCTGSQSEPGDLPSPPDVLFDVAVFGKTPRNERDESADETFRQNNESFDRDFYDDLGSIRLEDSDVDGIEAEYSANICKTSKEKIDETETFADDLTEISTANNLDNTICNSSSVKRPESMTQNATGFSECMEFTVESGDVLRCDDLRSKRTGDVDNMCRMPGSLIHKDAEPGHGVAEADFFNNGQQMKMPDDAVDSNNRCIATENVSSSDHDKDFLPVSGSVLLENSDLGHKERMNLPVNHESVSKLVGSLEAESADPDTDVHDNICNVSFSESELLQVYAPEENFDMLSSDAADMLFRSISLSPSSSGSEKATVFDDSKAGTSKQVLAKIATECVVDDELEEGEISDVAQNTTASDPRELDKSLCEKRRSYKFQKRSSFSSNRKQNVENRRKILLLHTTPEKRRRRMPSRRSSPGPASDSKSRKRHVDNETSRDKRHRALSPERRQSKSSSDRSSRGSRSSDRSEHSKSQTLYGSERRSKN